MTVERETDFEGAAEAYQVVFGEGVPFMLLPAASEKAWTAILWRHVQAGEPVTLESLERLDGVPDDVPPGACV